LGPLPLLMAYDEVSLGKGLVAVGLNTGDLEGVERFLGGGQGLAWRVQKFDGTVVRTEEVESLRLVVQDEIVTLAGSMTELPVYGNKTLHPGVTSGKSGGY